MKYTTEEERKEARKEYYQANKEKIAEYYQTNKEKITERQKQYYQANKEKVLEQQKQYKKQYRKTPMGRASNLANNHNQEDKKYNRGESSLTALWVRNYIFHFKCVYCGESDWRKLGCDRKDNSLPHTPSNVVPCCASCNSKRGTKPFEEFLAECNAEGRLKEWEEFLKQKDLEDIATT